MQNIDNINNFFNSMKDLEYGWIDKNNNKIINKIIKNKFIEEYRLLSPSEVMNNNIGICFDQVEYERKFFEDNNIDYKTYFVQYNDNYINPTHSFLIFKEKKYYWFENTYASVKGIRKYDNLKQLFDDVKKHFAMENKILYAGKKFHFFLYSKPTYGISVADYYQFCMKNEITEDDLYKW